MSKFLIDAPAVTSATGGLLDVANVITDQADSLAFHGVKHRLTLDGHTRTVPAPGTDKTFDEVEYGEGVEFATYRGIESALLLGEDAAAIAEEAFSAGETFAVEQAVQDLLLNPNAVDLTPVPGTAVTNVKAAIGLLEQWMRENYTGLPLLHTNLFGSSLALELVTSGGSDPLRTVNGTVISVGGGYGTAGPGGGTATGKQAWLYISGQVNLWKGSLNLPEAADLPGNRKFALAERAYAASIDGPVAAILIGF
jgi:hypothetical protein